MARRIAPTSTFIKRYMSANKVSQKQLSDLTGYSEKQISLMLNDKTNITPKFAHALAESIGGIKENFILDYAKRYQEQLENDKVFLIENDYFHISKEYYFNKIFKKITSDPVDQTNRILEAFQMDNLKDLKQHIDYNLFQKNVLFSKDISRIKEKDDAIVTIWTKIVMEQMLIGEESKTFVGAEKAKRILNNNKELLNASNSEDIMTNIKYICDLCGIHVGFSKSAPTTYIRGLTFSMKEQLFIVLTDRYKNIEHVVFAFIHEMFHVINGDITVEAETIRVEYEENTENEININNCARSFLISDNEYNRMVQKQNITLSDIFEIARKSRCSVGLVVSLLHHETKEYAKFWNYLNKFKIQYDIFGE